VAEQATVTAADIARLAGVGRAAVSNWRRRYEDFPQPVGGTANSPLFELAQIQEWLREQGKLQQASPWERLWQLVEAHRGDHEPADVLGAVGAFLLYLRGSGKDGWRRLRDQPDGSLAAALPEVVDTATADELPDLGPWPVTLTAQRAGLFREVADLASEHGAPATLAGLWDRFVQTNTRWINVTSPELAALMTELVAVERGTVLDPACGAGSLLVAAAKPGVRGLGQEIDPGLARLGVVRLALQEADAKVIVGESLLADGYPGELVDAVLCDPPFNERHWGHDDLVYDPRWEYGIPPKMESELAWLQHSLAHVKPGGVVVICMPPSAASRRSGRRIRAELLRRGALRAVIALPTALAPVHLWVLRKGEPVQDLLVVDANTPDWERTGELVRTAWQQFDDAEQSLDARVGEVRAVPVLNLLDEDVDLTPARNLPVSAAPTTPEQLLTRQRDLRARLAELTDALPVLNWAPQRKRSISTTIAELAKAGAVSILQTSSPTEPFGFGEPAMPLLDVDDLVAGAPPRRSVSREFANSSLVTMPGDVVVPTVGRALVARVVDGGIAIGKGLCVLRPTPQTLDSWFLAGFLSGSMSSRQASTHLSSAARLDVRRCEIPRLPLDEQRRYAEVFRQLAAFDTGLASVAALAREVVRATTDGLTDGIVAPPD
jgi:hypothetical protein